MKKLFILGAYDRYNFGDNLMPIVVTEYLRKYSPNIIEDYKLIYVSTTKSDLSNYSCLPTDCLYDYEITYEDVILVVGGQVINASASKLISYLDGHSVIRYLLKTITKDKSRIRFYISTLLSVMYLGCRNEYPFTPLPINDCKVIYNSVGGKFSKHGFLTRFLFKLEERFAKASYISVRDSQTAEGIGKQFSPNVTPDSVMMISRLFSLDTIAKNVRPSVHELMVKPFILLQATEEKCLFSPVELISLLSKVETSLCDNIYLLPIGYANGHDDERFLSKIATLSCNKFKILNNLNVWEIVYIIGSSSLFMGSSLHGIITSMSYNIPYIPITSTNKVVDYLNTWTNNSSQPLDVNSYYDAIESRFDSLYDGEVELNESLINKVISNFQKLFENIDNN